MSKQVFHIVATDSNRLIGKENQLPWHFSADLQHFKETTSGNTVIMGRKTYVSIGRPLPKRQNLVLSRTPQDSEYESLKYFTKIYHPRKQNINFKNYFDKNTMCSHKIGQ